MFAFQCSCCCLMSNWTKSGVFFSCMIFNYIWTCFIEENRYRMRTIMQTRMNGCKKLYFQFARTSTSVNTGAVPPLPMSTVRNVTKTMPSFCGTTVTRNVNVSITFFFLLLKSCSVIQKNIILNKKK